MKSTAFLFFLSTSSFIFAEDLKDKRSDLASIGAKTEALFFLQNKRNFFNEYLKNKVPKIEIILSTKDKNLRIKDFEILDKHLHDVIDKIAKENLSQEFIEKEVQKARLLKLLVDVQEEIINLIKETKAKTKTAEKFEPRANAHKIKAAELSTKLTGNYLLQELQEVVNQLEEFVKFCKKFAEDSSKKLQILKQKRLDLHKKTADAYNVKVDEFMNWWPIYLNIVEPEN